MGDLFDEFMREVARRRAEAEGRSVDGEDAEPGTTDGGDGDRAPDGEPEPITRRRSQRGFPGGGRGGGGGGGRPPRERVPDDRSRFRSGVRRLGIALLVLLALLLVGLAAVGVDLWTDVIWFRSVGYDAVFWTRLGTQVGIFVVAFIVALAVLLGTIWLAGRLAPPPSDGPGLFQSWADRLAEAGARQAGRDTYGPYGMGGQRGGGGPRPIETVWGDVEGLPDLTPVARYVLIGFAVLAALGVAGAATGSWETFLLWLNRVPFSPSGEGAVVDPIFHRDVGFFLFELPFLRTAQGIVNGLLFTALIVALARYLIAGMRGGPLFVTRVRAHLGILAGLYLLSVAAGYQLDKLDLVYSQAGVATGVSYTDANARFLALDVLTVIAGLSAALLVGGAFTRWLWPLGAAIGVWLLASVVLRGIYPEAVQRFVVQPNQYGTEQPYIANNMAMTRLAYGIDRWETKPFNGEAGGDQAAIDREATTFKNAPPWDHRALQPTLDQLQTVRQYYDFTDVDTDRYTIDGQLRQVMLSARELARAKNPSATGWVNQRVIYTHGIGLAMVPVNEVTREGQPSLFVRDLPPTSVAGAPPVTEPRIYFGELDNDYIVVGARQNEFDFPQDASGGPTNLENRWSGTSGIKLDTTLSRLLFALRFRDLDLLITDQVTNNSQLLLHRTLRDRLPRIAPFLRYDKDPYLVVDGRGHLDYIQDAYTWSDRFPQSTPFDPDDLGATTGLGRTPFNYLRNSVKVVVDAYDGTTTYYVADPNDPLVRAWSKVFPTLFKPISDLSPDLQPHLRVPEELFNVQTQVFGRYHVQPTDSLTFFQNADRWTVPQNSQNEQTLPTEAYYVVMRMPGEQAAEFLLLQPMIAANRPNMIAWIAARNDLPNYGTTRVYQFPANTTIFGPAQIEARIDQDPTISAQITLWNQSGSSVVRGNLLVVPVGNSLVYLQPIYLQSTSSAFPEFQRIVVASPSTVVWGPDLSTALKLLLANQAVAPPSPSPGAPSPGAPSPSAGPSATPGGPSPSVAPSISPAPGPIGLPSDVAGLVTYANVHFEAAQAALRAGDFATYGSEIARVQAALRRLGQVAPGVSASPAP